MTGIGASQKKKNLSRLLYRICGSGLNCVILLVSTLIIFSSEYESTNYSSFEYTNVGRLYVKKEKCLNYQRKSIPSLTHPLCDRTFSDTRKLSKKVSQCQKHQNGGPFSLERFCMFGKKETK